MAKTVVALGFACAALTGCSPASAAHVDPANDAHCFALATATRTLLEAENGPAYQREAATGLADWYKARLDKEVQARGRGDVWAEAASIAPIIERDVIAQHRATMACAERAAADPTFNAFAARYATRRP